MKRILSLAVALLLVAGTAFGWPLARVWHRGASGSGPWWNDSSLTFYAPFDDPADPLRLIKGTGTLSFTRATTAMRTAIDNGYLTSTPAGTLRIEAKGALIEGQRTNLVAYSEQFDQSWWLKEAVTITVNAAVAPDGTTTADKICDSSTTTAPHNLFPTTTPPADNSPQTDSVFAKAGEHTWLLMEMRNKAGTAYFARFNLLTSALGTVDAGCTATILYYGNGWYRCSITIADMGTGSGTNYMLFGAATNGTQTEHTGVVGYGIYIWGAQRETASFPSSYIPTVAAAVTRNADALTIANSGNISATAGTINAEGIKYNGVERGEIYDGQASSGNNRLRLYVGTSEFVSLNYGTGTGDVSASSGNTITVGTAFRAASAWQSTDGRTSLDGGTVVTNTSDPSITLGTNGTIGNNVDNNYPFYGNIKALRIWSRAFTDAELQTITSP
jgi:hypothetical protein